MTYKEMIDNIINTRGQHGLDPDSYFEMHHIVPAAWNGDGDWYDKKTGKTQFYPKSKHPNCLWVTPEEHFELHRLLWTENKNDKSMAYAFYCMTHMGNGEVITDKDTYAEIQKAMSKEMSETMSNRHFARIARKATFNGKWNGKLLNPEFSGKTNTEVYEMLNADKDLKLKIAKRMADNSFDRREEGKRTFDDLRIREVREALYDYLEDNCIDPYSDEYDRAVEEVVNQAEKYFNSREEAKEFFEI